MGLDVGWILRLLVVAGGAELMLPIIAPKLWYFEARRHWRMAWPPWLERHYDDHARSNG
jgi:hypothetical protein